MKIAGVVVLYNPEIEVLENIETYLDLVEVLYVVDNSTKENIHVTQLQGNEKVKHISLNGNQGIAKALKVATEKAIEEGFDWLLNMDQDSKFPAEDFRYIKSFIETNDTNSIGVIGVNFNGSDVLKDGNDKTKFIEVDDLITSGSLLNLKNYNKIEGYDERLFIDYVDFDLSYQFREKDFKLILFRNIDIIHSLGTKKKVKFLFYKREIVAHSPIRYYYSYRNYHYLLNHKSEKYLSFFKKRKNCNNFKNMLRRFLFEKPHFKILKMIVQGIKDGKKGKMGPYQDR